MTKTSVILLFAVLIAGLPLCAAQQQTPAGSTPSQSSGDIPSSKPGTNNPDIAPDSKPAVKGAGTSTKAKKTKRRKRTSSSTSSTHTAPTA